MTDPGMSQLNRYFFAACLSAGTFGCLCGCSPPPPSRSADELSVQMPGEGRVVPVGAPIEPPQLNEGELASGNSADPTTLVLQSGGQNPELVPTPSADAEADSGQAVGDTDEAGNGDPQDTFPDLEHGPDAWRQWPTPDVTLFVTGQQNGYIEPCGCTGLDRQKGGVARRFTFINEIRDKGWTVVPIDAGNQVRRFGRQAEVKLQQSVKAMKQMGYEAIGFGPDDIRLGVGELLSVAAGETPQDTMYASSNVVLIDPSLMPHIKFLEVNGMKIGITSLLDPASLESETSDDIKVASREASAMEGLVAIKEANPDFTVLMFFGKEEDGMQLMRDVAGYDLIVVAGGYGEPTYQPEAITGAKTRMIVTGNKGMYAGLVGLYRSAPLRYARVPLTHDFEDAAEMRQLMKEYQDQLRDIGLQGLGLLPPIPHSSGAKFVGTEKCAECHVKAFEVWEGTPHALATEHIVKPPKERGDIARHFDPECLSCHVTGWNPQEYYPYLSGYLSLEDTAHLTGNGCENCHGPGSEHVAAERDGASVTEGRRNELRDAMKLPLSNAREKCMTCHDLDNSPDFHDDDAFADVYWPQIEHYGKD